MNISPLPTFSGQFFAKINAEPDNLRDKSFAVLVETPRASEAELADIEAERRLNVGHGENGAGKPVRHAL
jgi:hypothetical protein